MGRLVLRTQIDLNASWYYNDAYYSSEGRCYRYEWPNPSFPYHVYIHNDTLYQHNSRKIEIRKWIEHTLTDVVIMDTVVKDYKRFYGKSYEWDKHWDVRNTWNSFSFENDHSASMFALAFSEWVRKEATAWHPDKPEDEEYLNRPEAERYTK